VSALILRTLYLSALLCIACAGLVGCDGDIEEARKRPVTLTVWVHESNADELRTIQAQVAAFNASQYTIRVNAAVIPGSNFNSRIYEALKNNKLPDIFEVESYNLAHYAWQGIVAPIDKHLTDHSTEGMPPAVLDMGRYGGRLYGVARHVDETVLFARRSVLDSLSIRIPDSVASAWSRREFHQVVRRICAKHKGHPALELPLRGQEYEALTQLLPAIRSAGGELVGGVSLTEVAGRLNSRPWGDVIEYLRGLHRAGCFATDGKGQSFFAGDAGLLWANSARYARLKARYGDDLLVLPLPDFGHGARTLPSGWLWTLSSQTQHPQAAMSLLEFMREDERLVAVADVNNDLPASVTALADPLRFTPGSVSWMLADLLLHGAVDLPPTPALPLFARSLGELLPDMIEGKRPVRPELDRVAVDLDRKIKGFERL